MSDHAVKGPDGLIAWRGRLSRTARGSRVNGLFFFETALNDSPAASNLMNVRNDFWSLLAENNKLCELLGDPNDDASPQWIENIRLAECANNTSDPIHRMSQDETGHHSLLVHLEDDDAICVPEAPCVDHPLPASSYHRAGDSQKPFLIGKEIAGLPAPPVGRRSAVVVTRNKTPLDTGGLLMEAATERSGAFSWARRRPWRRRGRVFAGGGTGSRGPV